MFPLAAVLGAALALAPPPPSDVQWMGWVVGGRSVIVFGSEDTRSLIGGAVQRLSPHPGLKLGGQPGQLVLEGYYHLSRSRGASLEPPNSTSTYGILAMGRYLHDWGSSRRLFFEFGMGLQYASQRTVDLSGRLSSTPTIGGGVVFDWAGETWALAVRVQHVSNAGVQGTNQGQNQLMMMLGVKF